jgi:hypothetical protein
METETPRKDMSRSGYSDDNDQQQINLWRGAVASAIRGRRGQAFLKEMLAAFDALPEKRLIDADLEHDGCVCSLGAVGRARGLDMSDIDPEDFEGVAGAFGLPESLAREVMYLNDDHYRCETPEERFVRMRAWVVKQIEGID